MYNWYIMTHARPCEIIIVVRVIIFFDPIALGLLLILTHREQYSNVTIYVYQPTCAVSPISIEKKYNYCLTAIFYAAFYSPCSLYISHRHEQRTHGHHHLMDLYCVDEFCKLKVAEHVCSRIQLDTLVHRRKAQTIKGTA